MNVFIVYVSMIILQLDFLKKYVDLTPNENKSSKGDEQINHSRGFIYKLTTMDDGFFPIDMDLVDSTGNSRRRLRLNQRYGIQQNTLVIV